MLQAAAEYYMAQVEARRQKQEGRSTLLVDVPPAAPTVDGDLNDWPAADWAQIDRYTTAAIAVASGKLFAAFQTGDPNLLENSGENWQILFKTGGGLDLMIGTNPAASVARTEPVPGDLRLLTALVNGQPMAVLYRPVVPGATDPVPFSSPWRTIYIDRVDPGEWVGYISLSHDIDIAAKTLLMTISIGYTAAAALGTYTIGTDGFITMVGGTYGNIPFDLVAGSLIVSHWRIPGDANRDCRVNILDLISVRNKLNQDPNTGDNAAADVNEDGRINILDLIFVRNRLSTICPPE